MLRQLRSRCLQSLRLLQIDSFPVTWGSQDTQVTVTGTTPEYISVRNSAVAQGQFQRRGCAAQQVSALGAETRTLFGNRDPIGGKSASEPELCDWCHGAEGRSVGSKPG